MPFVNFDIMGDIIPEPKPKIKIGGDSMTGEDTIRNKSIPLPDSVTNELKKRAIDAGLGFQEYCTMVLFNHVTYDKKGEKE